MAPTLLRPGRGVTAGKAQAATGGRNCRTFQAVASPATGEILMDETRTLSLLAWTVGGIVGVLFVLEAIALSLN